MSPRDDQRITAEHRKRAAFIYARQSSRHQLREHTESTRIQLDLREKAIAFGWQSPIVVGDDLGVSAVGFAERPGFQRMLTQISVREVGIIFCVEASRLSRNSKDWAHLFELCGYFDVLVSDLDQIYDLRQPNDRLVLGIKGTVAELEQRILNTRLLGAIETKAARGELRFCLPAGFEYDSDNHIAFNPDKRVQEAIRSLFERFEKFTSVRQLVIWYRNSNTLFPVKKQEVGAKMRWVLPNSRAVARALRHPIYAGAYVYGRHRTQVECVDGKLVKRKVMRTELEECKVLIRDHHPAYISWERFLANGAKIAENRPKQIMQQNRGAIREGQALLAGLLRCAHCGRSLYVVYKEKSSAAYRCDEGQDKGTKRCVSFTSRFIDLAVGEEVCRALGPLAIEAAIAAADIRREQREKEIDSAKLQLQATQYEANRAFEQFDRCDPKNRLVADTLEERLNAKLAQVDSVKRKIEALCATDGSLTADQRQTLSCLALDFPNVWRSPKSDPKTKKRILRASIREILVKDDSENRRLEVTIHWQGGVHTQIHVAKRTGWREPNYPPLVERVRHLAETLSDTEIARVLNMDKVETPAGLRWNVVRVKSFRGRHEILVPQAQRDPDHLSMKQARVYLGVSHNALMALVRMGAIATNQVERLAPWRVSRKQLDSERVQSMVRVLKATGRLPEGGCPEGQLTLFDEKS